MGNKTKYFFYDNRVKIYFLRLMLKINWSIKFCYFIKVDVVKIKKPAKRCININAKLELQLKPIKILIDLLLQLKLRNSIKLFYIFPASWWQKYRKKKNRNINSSAHTNNKGVHCLWTTGNGDITNMVL